jgi:hypothetical protein
VFCVGASQLVFLRALEMLEANTRHQIFRRERMPSMNALDRIGWAVVWLGLGLVFWLGLWIIQAMAVLCGGGA